MNTMLRWAMGSLTLLVLASSGTCLAQDGGGGVGGGADSPGAAKPIAELPWNLSGASGGFNVGFGGGMGIKSIVPLLRQDKRFPLLAKSVDVRLTNATVQQAAAMLTQMGGIKVHVDEKTVSDKRLSIDALSAPMATILDAVAQQTNLMIVRDGDGVALKPWPSLDINGQKSVYKGSLAPWADEWQTPQYPANTLLYLDAKGNPVYAGSQKGGGGDAFGGGGGGGFGGGGGGMPGSSGAGPLSMTFSGDKLVIAEAAFGPKGEPGYKISIYALTGSQLKLVTSTFHAAAGAGKQNRATGAFGGGETFGGGGFGGGGGGGGFGNEVGQRF